MKFAKYHGIGNDFVMIADPGDEIRVSSEDVRALCDRRLGVGADGVIRVAPAGDGAELFMDYANSDGSIGEMCGNGIRCLALFARAEGLTTNDEIRVLTRGGVKLVRVLDDGRVRVDMGVPVFEPARVPVRWEGPDALHAKIELEDDVLEAAALSMGNPHAVLFVDDPDAVPVVSLGRSIERHPMFPKGTNVEFAVVESEGRLRMRVWERGAGETLACGTGACAVAVASQVLRGTSASVTVALPGGELEIEWERGQGPVFMTGPATRVFEGEIDL